MKDENSILIFIIVMVIMMLIIVSNLLSKISVEHKATIRCQELGYDILDDWEIKEAFLVYKNYKWINCKNVTENIGG